MIPPPREIRLILVALFTQCVKLLRKTKEVNVRWEKKYLRTIAMVMVLSGCGTHSHPPIAKWRRHVRHCSDERLHLFRCFPTTEKRAVTWN